MAKSIKKAVKLPFWHIIGVSKRMELNSWKLEFAKKIRQYLVDDGNRNYEKIKNEFSILNDSFGSFSMDEKIEIMNWIKELGVKEIYFWALDFMKDSFFTERSLMEMLNIIAKPEEWSAYIYQINRSGCRNYKQIRDVYRTARDSYFKQFGYTKADNTCNIRNRNRVVILTEQMLSIRHAPTLIVFQWAYVFQKLLGMEVQIISIPSNYNTGIMFQIANCDVEFTNRKWKREFRGEEFTGYQLDYVSNSLKDYELLSDYIREWNPLFILHAGVFNPFAEVFHLFIPGAALRMSKGLPYSDAKVFLISENDKHTDHYEEFSIENYKQDLIVLDNLPPVFKPSEKVLNRRDIGFDEDDFLIAIVGNRLGREIDAQFVKTLERIVHLDDRIKIVIIGPDSGIEHHFSAECFDYKVHCLGYCEDLMYVYQGMDMYLNPFRTGGGYSAYMALWADIPVLTLPDGDVANNVGPDFCVDNAEEIPKCIEKYMKDEEYKKGIQEKIKDFKTNNSEKKFWETLEGNARKVISYFLNDLQ